METTMGCHPCHPCHPASDQRKQVTALACHLAPALSPRKGRRELAETEETDMPARKIPMTADQHIRHGAALKAAHLALSELQADLYQAARLNGPEVRAVSKTLDALTKLRYTLEGVALRDHPMDFPEDSDWLHLYARTDREFQR